MCQFHGKMLHWPNKNQLAVIADFTLGMCYKLCCEKDTVGMPIIGTLPSENTAW